jgi:4-alpha-glucanotransferase
MALVGTHDTPTFAGWLAGVDIDERVRCKLLAADSVPDERERRSRSVQWLADELNCLPDDPELFLAELLEWLGRSESPLVVPWLEDFWLEKEGVNLPGTGSSERPNWQRPMSRLLDEVFEDEKVGALTRRLDRARSDG